MYMNYRGTEFLQSPLSLSASGIFVKTTETAVLGSESGLKGVCRVFFHLTNILPRLDLVLWWFQP